VADQINEVEEESGSEDSSNEQPMLATNVNVKFTENQFSTKQIKRFRKQPISAGIEPDIIKPEKNFTSKKSFKSLALGKKELSSDVIPAKTSLRSQVKSYVNSKLKKTPEPEEEKKS
jgi:hypothetical protein